MRARNRWGWGFEDAAFSTADARAAAPGLVGLLGFGETEPEEPVAPDTVTLPAPRLQCPPQIGRASCRERGEMAGVPGAVQKKPPRRGRPAARSADFARFAA